MSLPARARLAVGVVSAGRVGSAVGAALERAGHVVAAVSAISDASVRRAQTRLSESQILPVADVAARSELLVLAVPDAELAPLVSGLAATGAVRPGTIVMHTSGANGIGVLTPLARQSELIVPLAIHPAMTFTGHDEDLSRMANACFGVTAADEIGYAIAQSLVIEMGGEPVRVSEAHRPLYHAALAHGANHLVTLVVDATAALQAALDGPGAQSAEHLLAPLLSAALDNALRRGRNALTGPVARGDAAAVSAHLDALGAIDPRVAASYRALSLRTAQQVHSTELIELLEQQ